MLTKKSKYALKALLYMAKSNNIVKINELSKEEKIPQKFLESILLELKKHGLLNSTRGKNGGYSLRSAPEDITFGQVIRILDGPLAPVPCVSQLYYKRCEECIDEATCHIRMLMKQVRDETSKILDGTSLSDVLKNETFVI
ncbi:MAG: Rrf2 family transcriptional regulator [Cytophagales bacterium]|nr:MAG: Rrf2 family transcriptional regulator [Cytophagales bacterium]